MLNRKPFLLAAILLLALVAALPAFAASSNAFPTVIPLPNGIFPEGIATGRGTSFYTGSLANGSVYKGDLRTGEGAILVPPQDGRISVGLAVDVRSNAVFAAGGPAGAAYVYDAGTGESLAAYQFTTDPSFVNDVVVTEGAAYFTDSFRPYMYRVPLGPAGELPDPATFQEIPLSGDFVFTPGAFNANGIEATPNGKSLIIVNSAAAELYRVDPATGEASSIDLGAPLPNGDGLLLDGKTLYVVQNFLNRIAVVRLSNDLASGAVTRTITDPGFDVPTTVAGFGSRLYAVNARFGTPPTPDTTYDVIGVSK